MALSNPVIVVPGITASELRDQYPTKPETVWSAILNKDYERLVLHPDDRRYELIEPARIGPDAVFKLPYGSLIEELRYNLTEKSDEPVPVYPFAYDWRQPLDLIEQQLADLVDEVIGRTSLLRHYDRRDYAKDPRVDFVGHSMGGMIIAGYLQRAGKKARTGKVATLGTPFRGSFEAPIKIITGTASLGGELAPASREREAARLTPALYHLLPSFDGAIHADPGLPKDLYSVDTWQDGVLQTLAEFIRLHGLRRGNKSQRLEQARELLADMLAIAKKHRDRIEGFTLRQAGLTADAWLCLVGVDTETRVRLDVRNRSGAARFELNSDHRRNEWGDPNVPQKMRTGDGTVPYLGAEPSFLRRANLVCLRPDDFGYWEIGDRVATRAAGFHGMLPSLNLAHRLIVSHFRGKATKGVWGRPAPGIDSDAWDPPIRGLELKN